MGEVVNSIVSVAAGMDPTGTVGAIYGNMRGKDANRAQRGMMDAQLQNEERMRYEAREAAAPSEYELTRLEDALKANQNEFERREKILASADPALIEAGKQALELMQGKEATALNPLRNQRAKQRQKLEQQLAAKLGPGYAESSAGIQALSAFDEATDNVLAGAQQQSLSQFLGVAQTSSAQNSLIPVSQQFGSLASLRGNINARESNALTGNQIKSVGGGQLQDYLDARTDMGTTAEMQARTDGGKGGPAAIMKMFGMGG